MADLDTDEHWMYREVAEPMTDDELAEHQKNFIFFLKRNKMYNINASVKEMGAMNAVYILMLQEQALEGQIR